MKILVTLLSFLYLGLGLLDTFADGSDNICQPGWIRKSGDNCYYVSNNSKSFDEAKKQCESMNSRLFPVSSKQDQSQLTSLLAKQSEKCKKEDNCHAFWIGVRRGKLEWTSLGGELIQTENHIWAPNYPAEKAGDCVILSLQKDNGKSSGQWKNEVCSKPFRFACFAKASPNTEISSPDRCPDVTKLISKFIKDVKKSNEQVLHEVKRQIKTEVVEFRNMARELMIIKGKIAIQVIHRLEKIEQLLLEDIGNLPETPKNKSVKKVCPGPFEYVPETNQCLYLSSVRLTWSDAQEQCAANGANLVAITDSTKQEAVRKYLRKQFKKANPEACFNPRRPSWGNVVWMGGQTEDPDECGTPYVWKSSASADTPFTYTNWYKRAPNCYYNGENCALMLTAKKYDYQWEDYVCIAELCSVCEI